MKRLKTPVVKLRDVEIGGENPIVIQAMTNTPTADADETAKQIMELADAGAEIVRITVDSNLSAEAVPKIREILDKNGCEYLPIIGDFHFNGHILLSEFPEMAKVLDKYRINPGNLGHGEKHDENFAKIIEIAKNNGKPVRIGVNAGSLDQELLTEMMNKNSCLKKPKTDREVLVDAVTESAMLSAKRAVELGLSKDMILLSVKMSDVLNTISAYRLLVKKMSQGEFFAIHLGLTEAGSGIKGVVSSSSALAILLNEGIGDTIRVSITPKVGEDRNAEVLVAKEVLQALQLRSFHPKVTSCPGCGRAENSFFLSMVEEVNKFIVQNSKRWSVEYSGSENVKFAVMGCVVNGPGEAKYSDIAISFPGKMEKKVVPVYIKGRFYKTLQGDDVLGQFYEIVEEYLKGNFPHSK